MKGPSLYAFKGLAGRIGPIGVHAALLLILAGTSYSGFGGFKGTVMMPEVSRCPWQNHLINKLPPGSC
jgi:cytochrome c biogenesis protein